ncbi:RHS repeat protein [Massilia sp. PAMC28688]|uniref:RHS repeat domain-containing protein n=1 Tax=Massilia sp. PAMC28688 TaxID=2861283 RepID=UPI001C62C822|nr:RHS repeat domain-containing protein [Massilia sp. PAMC28688]QYF93441.1 RHS repeat protein [Massilia sp. PAMC28688]
MNLSSLTALLGLAAALLVPAAQGASAAPARPAHTGLHMIIAPGMSLTMDGSRVLAKVTRRGMTTYHYEHGRLVRARHPDGRLTRYHYADGRLERIALPDGTVQTPLYVDGALAMIQSSSGKKLGLTPGARGVDKVALSPRGTGGSDGVQAMRAVSPRPGATSLNRTLIAIDDWESLKTEWECTLQPEGDTVCIGRPDQSPPSGDFGDDGRGWLPGDTGPGDGGLSNTPGDDGGGGAAPDGGDIPPNLNTQPSCIAAAKNTWEIMRDRICPMVHDQTLCLRQNWQLFLELRQNCIAAFPLP